MFKLVGEETFTFGASNAKGKIIIESVSGFTYGYSLMVNDKTLRKFVETQVQVYDRLWPIDFSCNHLDRMGRWEGRCRCWPLGHSYFVIVAKAA